MATIINSVSTERNFATAAQCAATLTAILAVVGLVAWMAGVTTITDVVMTLSGVFMGSFAMALFRPHSRRNSPKR